MKNKNASCKIYFEENKCYQQILNCEMINFYKDRFSVIQIIINIFFPVKKLNYQMNSLILIILQLVKKI